MRIYIKIRGIAAPDHSLQHKNEHRFQDYQYVCEEYGGEEALLNCLYDGIGTTCHSLTGISSRMSFTLKGVDSHLEQFFLKKLEEKLNADFSQAIPSFADLEKLSETILKLAPKSLVFICLSEISKNFTFFKDNLTSLPSELQKNIRNNKDNLCQEGIDKSNAWRFSK